MTKDGFLGQLTHRLGYLPYEEVKKSVDFYREAIDDRMEDGLTEEEAVAAMGSMDDIVREIAQTMPLSTIVKEKVKSQKERVTSRSGRGWLWIVLAICGFPVWFPLLITAMALVFTVYVVAWALVVSVFALAAGLAISGAVAAGSAFFLPYSGFAPRLMLFGAGLAVLGLALLFLPMCKPLAKASVRLIKSFGRWIKRLVIGRKERVEE